MGQKSFTLNQKIFFCCLKYKNVDHYASSIGEDKTVCKTIEKIALDFGSEYELSFVNGGDQNNSTIPERPICEKWELL